VAREAFSGHLDLLLLSALASEPRHGWGVIEHVRRRSDGRFDYPEGTIYPALHRLESEGLLRSSWSNVEGRRRRVYELTRRGYRALDGRKQEWHDFARTVTAVIEQASG
jgi:PadR family transcriptional regulator PadR